MDIDTLLKQVNEEKLISYTKNISKEVRISGSDEEFLAFQYTKEQLDSMGFDTRLYKRKGYISYPVEAKLRVNGKSYNAITHSMAPSTNGEGITAEVIYVGEGKESDYTMNVSGKMVLIDGLAIPATVAIAEQKGAAAAVFINAEYTHEMIVSSVWGNPADSSGEGYPTLPSISINFKEGNEIKEKLMHDKVSIFIKTTVITEWRDIPTLIADYKGLKDPDDYVLFSGHIDSWHYGAMDNGSANATILEVARVISENKVRFHRSLRLAFWSGHSHGRYAGSTLYADENWEDLYDHCVLHVNVDSVGGKNAVVLSEGNTMAETKNIAEKPILNIAEQKFNGTRYGRAGDQSFWGPGVPSLLMGLSEQEKSDTPEMAAFAKLFGGGKGGGFGWWWHTTEDTLDKIDFDYLRRDCQIYLNIILETCTHAKLSINQFAAAKEISEHVNRYSEKMPHIEAFQIMKNRTKEMIKTIIDAEDIAKQISEHEDDKVKQYNEWNKEMSRGLVRLNYVKNSPFDHDPTTITQPVPLLAGVLKYEKADTIHEKLIIENRILRDANKVNFILRGLVKCTKDFISNCQANI